MKKEAPVYKIEHVSETATDFRIPKFILNNIEKKIIERSEEHTSDSSHRL